MAIARPISKKRTRIEEMKKIILEVRPEARFKVTPAPDVRGITAIWTYTNAEFDDISRLVVDTEFRVMIEDGIHIIVIPMPLEAWED
ncbi:MAG: hypothetical protein AAB092_06060 [Chloroflexota bacterium]